MFENDLMKINIELRKLAEKVQDGSIKSDEAQIEFDKLKIEKREIEKKIAQASVSIDERSSAVADIAKAMVEKRAITLNGTGAINQISEIAKEFSKKKEILQHVKYFYGANATTAIPVLSPSVAKPSSFAEGASSIPNDTQAQVIKRELTPHAFVSILPVTGEALKPNSFNLESELPIVFADAFSDAFADGVIKGTGGFDFSGLFNAPANTISIGGTTPVIADLVGLALSLKDYSDDAYIVMNPSIYSIFLADSTNTSIVQLYREELIRNKTIEGVKVLLTGYAPNSTASDSIIAVGGRLSDYGVAIASEITIEPIKVLGSTSTFFQASVYANGAKIVENNFSALIRA